MKTQEKETYVKEKKSWLQKKSISLKKFKKKTKKNLQKSPRNNSKYTKIELNGRKNSAPLTSSKYAENMLFKTKNSNSVPLNCFEHQNSNNSGLCCSSSSCSSSSASTYEEWIKTRKSKHAKKSCNPKINRYSDIIHPQNKTKYFQSSKVKSYQSLNRNSSYKLMKEYIKINERVCSQTYQINKISALTGESKNGILKEMFTTKNKKDSQPIDLCYNSEETEEKTFEYTENYSSCQVYSSEEGEGEEEEEEEKKDFLLQKGKLPKRKKYIFPFGERKIRQIENQTIICCNIIVERATNVRFTGNHITVHNAKDCEFEGNWIFCTGSRNKFKTCKIAMVFEHNNCTKAQTNIVLGTVDENADTKQLLYGYCQ